MDHLPQTLLCLIDGINDKYDEFSWTSQEINGKLRVTLIWTNEQYTRKKSKSTKKRDLKRREEYVAQKQKSDNKQNEKSEEKNQETDDELETNSEMDINDNLNTLCDASTQVNIISRPRRKTPVASKQPSEQVITDVKNRVSDNLNTERTNTQNNGNERLKENRPRAMYKRRFLSKVVIKKTSGSMTTLIGRLPGKNDLIVHSIPDKKNEIMTVQNYEYRTYRKNIMEDFQDVTETDYMCDIVNNSIRLMEIFVENMYEELQ